MACELTAFTELKVKDKDIQLTLGCDLRVQLSQASGCCISGVCKQRLTCFFPLFIQCIEHFLWHEHFTTDNQPLGCVLYAQRDGTDCFQVFRNVLTDASVASGRAADEFTVNIFQ